ncbi:MAG: photoactive yellow protein [Spirochaetes bacterium]|nr:photoactive yellow protein [Spirochaetota bacterium]
MTDPVRLSIDDSDLAKALDELAVEALDRLDFGVVRMDRAGQVLAYNTAEAELSGLAPTGVVGQDFFVQVAPCTNNYLVAQRFRDEDELDESIDYVFTFRMLPTPVRLRMLKRPDSPHQYLVVQRA